MQYKKGRYSGVLRPLSYGIDFAIIFALTFYFFGAQFPFLYFVPSLILCWTIISLKNNFYEVYRFTHVTKIVKLIGFQTILFTLIVLAFLGIFKNATYTITLVLEYVFWTMCFISVFKLSIYLLLKKYRLILGGNHRSVVIVGLNQKTEQLRSFFENNPEYGYRLLKTFELKKKTKNRLESCIDFIEEHQVEEIYSSVAELSNDELNRLIDYADNNLKILKFLPDNKDIYTKRMDFTYYGVLPILALRKIPIQDPFNKFIKRSFDVVLSIIILVGILSWLTPLLGLLIKLESKGPIFFKQKRNGLDYEEFFCYKFRSMRPNPTAHIHQVRKGDERITRIGRFIRKTSIDELPQFINVLKGDMAVVGPRPHMVSHTHMYAERIDKFMVRHFIKPGITGLAQVSGYRGEVESKADIVNRVKYDIFYLENWSLLLDFKIIFLTIYNALKGEEKAY